MTYRGPGATGAWVFAAAPGCARDGCQLRHAAGILNYAEQVLQQKGREGMSDAKWCDAGGHAFSVRDKGRQRITVTVTDDETGEEKDEARDFCGACAAQAGLLKSGTTRPAYTRAIADAPTAEPPRADPARITKLETELGMGSGPGVQRG